ncbi:hypothetical protein QE152_g4968 [Popillia japonica]|uniref:Transposase n=1 Tax=Popillia japonica TaxID=7064 RepID=A0AAW1MY68_POPJA
MNQKCLENAPHVEQHSIDEAMVPYFGRHPGKQFIKGKLFGMGINCGLVQRFMDTLSALNPIKEQNRKCFMDTLSALNPIKEQNRK